MPEQVCKGASRASISGGDRFSQLLHVSWAGAFLMSARLYSCLQYLFGPLARSDRILCSLTARRCIILSEYNGWDGNDMARHLAQSATQITCERDRGLFLRWKSACPHAFHCFLPSAPGMLCMKCADVTRRSAELAQFTMDSTFSRH